jgi:D-aminopeptidase
VAKAGPVTEGSVGAGTGTVCFGWKGGIGTSSRVLPAEGGGYTLGVLVQSNFGGILTMDGAPVGKELNRYEYSPRRADGSCMIVVATNAPLSGHQCQRVAARAVFGLARTGSSFSNGSGDFGIAFSTALSARTKHNQPLVANFETVTTEGASFLFEAALEATEEAVYNSLLQATTMQSRYRTVEAIPIDRVRQVLSNHGIKPTDRR